jgi:hypothetical protein
MIYSHCILCNGEDLSSIDLKLAVLAVTEKAAFCEGLDLLSFVASVNGYVLLPMCYVAQCYMNSNST